MTGIIRLYDYKDAHGGANNASYNINSVQQMVRQLQNGQELEVDFPSEVRWHSPYLNRNHMTLVLTKSSKGNTILPQPGDLNVDVNALNNYV
jgi:hypothetical protein